MTQWMLSMLTTSVEALGTPESVTGGRSDMGKGWLEGFDDGKSSELS